jgi:CBS domain-containing protein
MLSAGPGGGPLGPVRGGWSMQIDVLLEQKGTAVATIPKAATVAQAVAELARHGVGALVVSEDGAAIDGIISERDVVRRLDHLGDAVLAEPVASIMSTTVFTCTPADDTMGLMRAMTERRIRHVPVVENGRLAGIVSIGDVVKARIGELEKDRTELMEYITAR